MNIVVIGCGKIGTSVVSSLVSEGHDAVVVDTDPDIITEVTNIYDVIGVCGNGADCRTLREASVERPICLWRPPARTSLICWLALWAEKWVPSTP